VLACLVGGFILEKLFSETLASFAYWCAIGLCGVLLNTAFELKGVGNGLERLGSG
jgi:hypothetical protein